jgi:hypothetical protein
MYNHVLTVSMQDLVMKTIKDILDCTWYTYCNPDRITSRTYNSVTRDTEGNYSIVRRHNCYNALFRIHNLWCPNITFGDCDCNFHTYIDVGLINGKKITIEINEIHDDKSLSYQSYAEFRFEEDESQETSHEPIYINQLADKIAQFIISSIEGTDNKTINVHYRIIH